MGSVNGYLTVEELDSLKETMVFEFPELVQPVKIGETYEGREIMGLIFTSGSDPDYEKPAMFISGAHHAREFTTIS